MKTIRTRDFGEVHFEEEEVLTFAKGLVGFEDFRRFILVRVEGTDPFHVLLSLDQTDLNFPLLHSDLVLANGGGEYQGLVEGELGRPLEGEDIFFVVQVGARPEEARVNLRGPILLNTAARTGRQCVLVDSSLPMDHRLISAPVSAGEGR